jgi:hypothetical protein
MVVLYVLRPKYYSMSDYQVRFFLHDQHQLLIRKSYNKLQKILLQYCRHPKAKDNAIIDVARANRAHSFIDMTSSRIFFQLEIPYKFPIERCRDLIFNILERIRSVPLDLVAVFNSQQNSMNIYEINYHLFDTIVMPIITRYTDNDEMFRQLFNEKMLIEFMGTMFSEVKPGIMRI